MLQIVRYAAVFLAVTGLCFAWRWPRRLPYRNTAVLGGLAGIAIAGSPLAFSHGSLLMLAGSLLGVILLLASAWTVVQAARR